MCVCEHALVVLFLIHYIHYIHALLSLLWGFALTEVILGRKPISCLNDLLHFVRGHRGGVMPPIRGKDKLDVQ